MTDATWIIRFDSAAADSVAAGGSASEGPRLAVKDCIDIAGTPTTAGCPAVADGAHPAEQDAPIVESARQQGARIVGKTNLVELCRHSDGVNPWTGTPTNPIDPERVPGGSSNGSAVAVARGEADVAYGTDTGGSIRVPAACCGIAGLKTTSGRVPTHGVFEFSRTLDTVGPMAPDVAGLSTGMRLMEPGFTPAAFHGDLTVARLRFPEVEEGIDDAVDRVLAAAGAAVTDITIPEWEGWIEAADDIMTAEGYWAHRHLMDRAEQMEERHSRGIKEGGMIDPARVARQRRVGMAASANLGELLDRYHVLALPTIRTKPQIVGERNRLTYLTVPFNLAGLPSVALPVPRTDDPFPASIQLVGSWMGEEDLLGVAAHVESSVPAA